jgi:hypothetical protein
MRGVARCSLSGRHAISGTGVTWGMESSCWSADRDAIQSSGMSDSMSWMENSRPDVSGWRLASGRVRTAGKKAGLVVFLACQHSTQHLARGSVDSCSDRRK